MTDFWPLCDLELAQLVLKHATDYAIFTIDRSGRVTGWSPGAERVLGFKAQDMIGGSFARLFSEADIAAGVPMQEIEHAYATGRSEDTRWHLRESGERFWANGLTVRVDTAEFDGLMKVLRDETPARVAEEQRVLLLNELNHRIKNTLATVQSVTEQTLRARKVDPAIRQDLTSRLMALSQAHEVLVRENWAGADLATVVRETLNPFDPPDHSPFLIDGPLVRLSPHQAVIMALALHELATNATKYGALSAPTGTVTVTWNVYHDGQGARHMTFLWKERGGPHVQPPKRSGFGSRLIARSFAHDSGGSAQVHYEPEGLRCVAQIPLSSAEAHSILDVNEARR